MSSNNKKIVKIKIIKPVEHTVSEALAQLARAYDEKYGKLSDGNKKFIKHLHELYNNIKNMIFKCTKGAEKGGEEKDYCEAIVDYIKLNIENAKDLKHIAWELGYKRTDSCFFAINLILEQARKKFNTI